MALRLLSFCLLLAGVAAAQAPLKGLKPADLKEIKLGEDEPGCTDSALLPRIAGCSIIQCDHKDSATVEVFVSGAGGDGPQKEVMEGPTEIKYYLCPSKTSQSSIVKQSEAALVKAGFKTAFNGKDEDDQPTVAASKETQWVQISTYVYNEYSAYIQTTVKDTPEAEQPATAAAAKKP